MGFYPQPKDYLCGPFALKHALVTLGRLADEATINQIAHGRVEFGLGAGLYPTLAASLEAMRPSEREVTPDAATAERFTRVR